MGRAKVLTKKLPIATTKEVVESSASNPLPVQRKRGRPRKVLKEELPAEEKKVEDEKLQLTESEDGGKKRKRPKKGESTDGGPESNGGKFVEEPVKPKIGKREGRRRKSEPRRAAGCKDSAAAEAFEFTGKSRRALESQIVGLNRISNPPDRYWSQFG